MKDTSAFSPLGDQSRKRRTTKAMNRNVMVFVLFLCISIMSYLNLYRHAHGLIQVEKAPEVSMERANANEASLVDAGVAGRAMPSTILLQTIPPNNSLTVPVDYFRGTEYCLLNRFRRQPYPSSGRTFMK
jgi:hypothetical protein